MLLFLLWARFRREFTCGQSISPFFRDGFLAPFAVGFLFAPCLRDSVKFDFAQGFVRTFDQVHEFNVTNSIEVYCRCQQNSKTLLSGIMPFSPLSHVFLLPTATYGVMWGIMIGGTVLLIHSGSRGGGRTAFWSNVALVPTVVQFGLPTMVLHDSSYDASCT